MPRTHPYTISEAARELGKERNRKLIRKLIRAKKIKTFVVGSATCIAPEGFGVLKKAVHEWDGRSRLNSLAMATAAR